MKSVSFLNRLHRGAVKVDKPGMKGLKYMTSPKNSWSLVAFVGTGRACTASNLSCIWVDTFGIIQAAKEIDGFSLHVCFLWVEHQVVFAGNLHEVS